MRAIGEIKAKEGLRNKVLLAIRKKEQKRARFFAFSSLIFIVPSVWALFIYTKSVFEALYSSGFSEYLSLIFSDTDIVFAYWREFSLSLVESIPFANIIIVLILAVLVAFSARVLARNIKNAFSPLIVN